MVLAAINPAFAQDSFDTASAQWRLIADQLRAKFPKLSELMDGAEADVLAYMCFPKAHRAQIHTTNPLERLNAEVKRRTDVVGHLPQLRRRHSPGWCAAARAKRRVATATALHAA